MRDLLKVLFLLALILFALWAWQVSECCPTGLGGPVDVREPHTERGTVR
jgi:hypothetical protein